MKLAPFNANPHTIEEQAQDVALLLKLAAEMGIEIEPKK